MNQKPQTCMRTARVDTGVTARDERGVAPRDDSGIWLSGGGMVTFTGEARWSGLVLEFGEGEGPTEGIVCGGGLTCLVAVGG
mmetsp:Transcript_123695/g.231428  ORF Transcript_123695/g.231428 Transcript_123695/m.231428 type:complete len:82 (-) Transcript_123695:298-543(-)